MIRGKYIFLVSSDAKKLHNLALAFADECRVIDVHYVQMILKYLFYRCIFQGERVYGKFDKALYGKLIRNNLQRKLIRNNGLFRWSLLFNIYKYLMCLKCHVLQSQLNQIYKENEFEKALIWNGSLFPQSMFAHWASQKDLRTCFFENGQFPNTIQVDSKGINYNSSITQDPHFYQNFDFKPEDQLPKDIGIRYTKLNYSTETYKLPKKFIFVPFQVPSDMQVLELSPWIKNMYDFYNTLDRLTKDIEDICFVIKEHPSFKLLIKDKVTKNDRILFANGLATKGLIEESEAVITINSTVGMEALLLKKPVITLGHAMYNVQGLVTNALSYEVLRAVLENGKVGAFDEGLRQNFLKYIYNYFLVKGSYQEITSKILDRIRSI